MCTCLEPVAHCCGNWSEFLMTSDVMDFYRCSVCNVVFGRPCELLKKEVV